MLGLVSAVASKIEPQELARRLTNDCCLEIDARVVDALGRRAVLDDLESTHVWSL